jgi:transposase
MKGFAMLTAVVVSVVVVVMLMAAARNRRSCPRCSTQMPMLRRPTSAKQALWGGWSCPNCGHETDRQGRALDEGRKPA